MRKRTKNGVFLYLPFILLLLLLLNNAIAKDLQGIDENAKPVASDAIIPPFFKGLQDYVFKNEDPWSSPGHQKGVGFLKAEPGVSFYRFFGPNIFKADVSSSMGELGSILGHSGNVRAAEEAAAKTFGADYTYFVTNGTTTSNKIIFHATVTPGDVVLADRNCHKSVIHAIMMTRSIPVYYLPTRNAYGIIGPISNNEFSQDSINKKIAASPFIDKSRGNVKPKLSVVTNSTYDGLCYYAAHIKNKLKESVDHIFFDEAWYGYAKFHPLYNGRYAMSNDGLEGKYPPVFATQSTHKMLSAFSMASMIHIKNGSDKKIDPDIFNEAWLMHTTTSPFYPLVASIEVASKMMEGDSGKKIVSDMLRHAIVFRKRMATSYNKAAGVNDWWFKAWQPSKLPVAGKDIDFDKVNDDALMNTPDLWVLQPGARWHGFKGLDKENILLDPLKVTILTPGITDEGGMDEKGIPALIVSKYLAERNIVTEKEGFYNLLFLFSPGVTQEKADRLFSTLQDFKKAYDINMAVSKIFPDLIKSYHGMYDSMGLKDLCQALHTYLKKQDIVRLMQDVYLVMPEQRLLPAVAYDNLVRGNVEYVSLNDLTGRISAVLLAPYPPGIPVIMPGEAFTQKEIIDYFKMNEEIDNLYPGFGIEIHGIITQNVNGKTVYKVLCVK